MDNATPSAEAFKNLFMLEPGVTFLNHGSYGATPKPVFETYQAWQRRLERQPVRFFRDELSDLLTSARSELATYLSISAANLVFVPNATTGVNAAAHALSLGVGDEVLSTDQEYGACDHVWQHLAKKKGFKYKKVCLPLPLASDEDLLERLWTGVTDRTKVIFLSHITSATAQTFPVTAVCKRAREEGILTLVDGAHTPGQVSLDLGTVGADMYTGNCHKWLCSPKGAGFLHVRPESQHLVEPHIIGWRRVGRPSLGSSFQDDFEFLGTADPSAYLSVPAAIRFQDEFNWSGVRQRCHDLLAHTLETVSAQTGRPSAYRSEQNFAQMAIVEIPEAEDLAAFQLEFLERHSTEVPFTQHGGKTYARISVQAYNTEHDLERLKQGLLSLE